MLDILEELDKECERIAEIGKLIHDSGDFLAALVGPDNDVSPSMREYGLLQLSATTVIADTLLRLKNAHDTMHQGMSLLDTIKKNLPSPN